MASASDSSGRMRVACFADRSRQGHPWDNGFLYCLSGEVAKTESTFLYVHQAIISEKVVRLTFNGGFTVSEIRAAMRYFMSFSFAMSTILCVMTPSNITMSTPLAC